MLARPRVPPASRLTPAGSVTFAVTCAAGPEPVLSTAKPTMPVTPGVSVPTGLIRAAIWARGASPDVGTAAGAVDGDAGDVPGAAEDCGAAAEAGWLPGVVAGWVDTDAWPGWDAAGAEPGAPGAEPGAPGAEPGAPAPGWPGADGPEPGWREADESGPGDVDAVGAGAPAAAGGRARCAGAGPECPVSAMAAAAMA